MTPCVYLICNLLNGKVYVGKTNNAGHRWAQHVSASRGKRHHMPIVRAIKKYGAENFTFEVLERFNTEEAALEAECRWISHYESNNPAKGYNLDGGGRGGHGFESSRVERRHACGGVARWYARSAFPGCLRRGHRR